jgi:hypothetical protein
MSKLCAYEPCTCPASTGEIFRSDVCAILAAQLVNPGRTVSADE